MKNRVTRIRYHGKVFLIINIVLFVYLACLAIGYAFFSESLTINGVASTVDYYAGTALPTTPVILDSQNNRYHLASNVQSKISFTSENWADDTITLTYTKYFGMSIGSDVTSTFKVSFSNPTTLPYTDGEVKAEITENTGGMLKDVSATISSTTLQPNEICEVTLNFHTKITWRPNTETAKVTVSYTLQGKPRYFYLILTYVAD